MVKLDFLNKIVFVKDMSPAQRKIVVISTAVLTVAGIATATYFVVKNQMAKKKQKLVESQQTKDVQVLKENIDKKIENK